MRNAPPVQYPVGLFLWGQRLVMMMAGLVLLAGPALLWTTPNRMLSWGVSTILALALALALRKYQHQQCLHSGQLQWQEGQWSYLKDEHAWRLHDLRMLWDAGDRVWLRALIPTGDKLQWRDAWLLKRDDPASWHALRCALAAHTGKNFTQPSHLA